MIALAAVLALTGPQPETPGQDPGVVDGCLITLIDEVDVPAQEPGMLVELKVVEGQQVKEGELIGQIDDSTARKAEEVAQYKLNAAFVEAKNDINVRFAKAGYDVTRENYRGMQVSNQKQPGTIPDADMREKYLEVEKFRLQIEQATHEQEVANMKASIQQGELDAARLDVEHRQIKSRISGEVVERYVHQGEWVKPGDKVVHVVRRDLLRVNGTLDGNRINPADVEGKPVTVEVMLGGGRIERFSGKVVFVNPGWESGGKIRVWAEVYNRQEDGRWLLGYNMNARMIIDWQQH
jgi:multidrug resistance efflux pump